jgi:hypothetical protein
VIDGEFAGVPSRFAGIPGCAYRWAKALRWWQVRSERGFGSRAGTCGSRPAQGSLRQSRPSRVTQIASHDSRSST